MVLGTLYIACYTSGILTLFAPGGESPPLQIAIPYRAHFPFWSRQPSKTDILALPARIPWLLPFFFPPLSYYARNSIGLLFSF
jgi:hypothetical protein